MIREGDGVGAQALRSLGISLQAVRDQVQETIGTAGTVASGSPPFTPRAKKVLELALREALQMNHSYIGTEHMLLGLVREGEGVAATVLVSLGADLPQVRREVSDLMSGAQEREGVRRVGVPAHPSRRVSRVARAAMAPSAKWRDFVPVIAPDEGSADPLPVHLVYCTHCGTVLHMFKADVPS